MVIADLQVSNGDRVAAEIGKDTTFVPTDVSRIHLVLAWAPGYREPQSCVANQPLTKNRQSVW